MADSVKPNPGRQMAYPYTITAKVARFPYKFYFEKGWLLKYYFISVALCIPIFHKISTAVNSPENKLKWKKIREQWYGDHSGH